MVDVGIRYVAESGDDANDGLSWAVPKRTGYAAITSLPVRRGSTPDHHVGKVMFGRGVFPETQPWPVNAGITLEGLSAYYWGPGTIIRRDHAGQMIEPGPTFTDYAHNVSISNMVFDGNKASFPTVVPLIVLNHGGFNTVFRDVQFRNAPGVAVSSKPKAPLNIQFDNVTARLCDGGVLDITMESGVLGMFSWSGGQVDICGDYPITIDDRTGSAGGADSAMFAFRGIKFESETDHIACIRFKPGSSTRSPIIRVENVWGYNWPGSATSLCYEPDGSGLAARWVIGPASVNSTYDEVFVSDKKGTNSAGRRVVLVPEEF